MIKQGQEVNHVDQIATHIKLGAVSTGTFFVGAWNWLGENQSELGGLASVVGTVGVCYTMYRTYRKSQRGE